MKLKYAQTSDVPLNGDQYSFEEMIPKAKFGFLSENLRYNQLFFTDMLNTEPRRFFCYHKFKMHMVSILRGLAHLNVNVFSHRLKTTIQNSALWSTHSKLHWSVEEIMKSNCTAHNVNSVFVSDFANLQTSALMFLLRRIWLLNGAWRSSNFVTAKIT